MSNSSKHQVPVWMRNCALFLVLALIIGAVAAIAALPFTWGSSRRKETEEASTESVISIPVTENGIITSEIELGGSFVMTHVANMKEFEEKITEAGQGNGWYDLPINSLVITETRIPIYDGEPYVYSLKCSDTKILYYANNDKWEFCNFVDPAYGNIVFAPNAWSDNPLVRKAIYEKIYVKGCGLERYQIPNFIYGHWNKEKDQFSFMTTDDQFVFIDVEIPEGVLDE